jgi:hypothetical protein
MIIPSRSILFSIVVFITLLSFLPFYDDDDDDTMSLPSNRNSSFGESSIDSDSDSEKSSFSIRGERRTQQYQSNQSARSSSTGTGTGTGTRRSREQPRSRSLGPRQNSPEVNDRNGYASPPITNSFSDQSDKSEDDSDDQEDDDGEGAFLSKKHQELEDTRIRVQASRSRSRKNTATSYPFASDATENHDPQQLPTPRNIDYGANSDDLQCNNDSTGKDDDTLAAESSHDSRLPFHGLSDESFESVPLQRSRLPLKRSVLSRTNKHCKLQ